MNAEDFLDSPSVDSFLGPEIQKRSPLDGMTGTQQFMAGAGRGMASLYRGGKQLAYQALFPENDPERMALDEEIKLAAERDAPLMEGSPGRYGNILGQAVSGLPAGTVIGGGGLGLTMLKGAALGSGMGALEETTEPSQRGERAIYGALGGAAGGAVGKGLEKVLAGPLSSSVSDQAKQMMRDGISLTPGQAIMSEGASVPARIIRGFEERAKAWPITGPVVKNAEKTAFRDWNQWLGNRVAPEGYTLRTDKTAPLADKIEELGQEFSKRYSNVLGGKFIGIDENLVDDFARIEADYTRKLGAGVGGKDEFKHQLNYAVSELADRGGYSGDQWKLLEGSFRDLSQKAWRDSNKPLANAYDELGKALKENLYRQLTSSETRALKALDKKYGDFATVQRAASSVAAQKNGLVTPSQVLSASKAGDKTAGKRGFSRGKARLQDEALTANDVLGFSIPDVGPGTAEKLIPALMAGGKMALLAHDLGTGGMFALASSRTGMRGMMGALPYQQRLAELSARTITPSLESLGSTRYRDSIR